MFRYYRQSAVKKKGGGVLLYIPVKLAPKLRPDLILFDKEKYESVWVCAILPDGHSATFRRHERKRIKALLTEKYCEGG